MIPNVGILRNGCCGKVTNKLPLVEAWLDSVACPRSFAKILSAFEINSIGVSGPRDRVE